MEEEKILQILGMTWVRIIITCLAFAIVNYVSNVIRPSRKQNKKLLDNMDNLSKKTYE